MVFSVERNPSPKSDDERAAILAAPGFGRHFTDHMVRIDFADGQWGDGRVVPYGPLTLDPATSALHYGQEIFEGLKAYRQPDGTIACFRPDASAAPGGTGDAKCAGNYAAAFLAQAQATAKGCDQVVWLDAAEHRWVEEMGGMNLYFVYGSGPSARIVTPALTGTLLPGITRDSLLTLAKELGYGAEEGKISTDELREGVASGAITEVFACGTAAVITPVGAVAGEHGSWTVGDG